MALDSQNYEDSRLANYARRLNADRSLQLPKNGCNHRRYLRDENRIKPDKSNTLAFASVILLSCASICALVKFVIDIVTAIKS